MPHSCFIVNSQGHYWNWVMRCWGTEDRTVVCPEVEIGMARKSDPSAVVKHKPPAGGGSRV
jgi:uncharacterized protein YbbK (DUF523 family)